MLDLAWQGFAYDVVKPRIVESSLTYESTYVRNVQYLCTAYCILVRVSKWLRQGSYHDHSFSYCTVQVFVSRLHTQCVLLTMRLYLYKWTLYVVRCTYCILPWSLLDSASAMLTRAKGGDGYPLLLHLRYGRNTPSPRGVSITCLILSLVRYIFTIDSTAIQITPQQSD